jgi:hypothetical protein
MVIYGTRDLSMIHNQFYHNVINMVLAVNTDKKKHIAIQYFISSKLMMRLKLGRHIYPWLSTHVMKSNNDSLLLIFQSCIHLMFTSSSDLSQLEPNNLEQSLYI